MLFIFNQLVKFNDKFDVNCVHIIFKIQKNYK